jgi:hypothetical protein
MEIYCYEPVESVAGALALLAIIQEFGRNENELNRRPWDPERSYKVCQGPAVAALPVLNALADRYAALIAV